MIPKTIHYCWFGRNPKPKLAQKCIRSWKKYCPDYEIIEWNEDNFDVNMNGYTRMCYEHKKWAFLSDYTRLWVVYRYGGIYFDTDVELLKNPDFLLNETAFFGFETVKPNNQSDTIRTIGLIASGLAFGSIAGGLALKAMLNEYEPLIDGQRGVIGCPELNTNALIKLGLVPNGKCQTHAWGTAYSPEYFNPLESSTGRLRITENTVSIHWYMGSFLTPLQKLRSTITRPFHRFFGKDCFAFLKGKN